MVKPLFNSAKTHLHQPGRRQLSRRLAQHLVDLLENKAIPYHKVGTHRRVTFKDLLVYERTRDKTRREALDQIAAAAEAAGLYDSDHTGER